MVSSFFSDRQNTQRRPVHPADSAARTNVTRLIRRIVCPRGYASGFFAPAALPAGRRVLARLGWAGEIIGLFEHPAHGEGDDD
ncbi:MAG: hypothetical protein C4293_02265 [Nitrospiraceae bacterium]